MPRRARSAKDAHRPQLIDDRPRCASGRRSEAGAGSLDELCARAALPVSQCLAAVTATRTARRRRMRADGRDSTPASIEARSGSTRGGSVPSALRVLRRVRARAYISVVLPRHVYVHVPFCARRCSYCDFSIAVRRVVPVDEYIAALAARAAIAIREDRAGRSTRCISAAERRRVSAARASRDAGDRRRRIDLAAGAESHDRGESRRHHARRRRCLA